MVAAPGEAMNVHEQNPPTDLTIFLNKSKFEESEEQFILPEPLGDPLYEKFRQNIVRSFSCAPKGRVCSGG